MLFIDDHFCPEKLAQSLEGIDPSIDVCAQFFDPPKIKGISDVLEIPLVFPELVHRLSFLKNEIQPVVNTQGCFNFMVYKPREFRLKALKAVEHFSLKTDYYTSSISEPYTGLPFASESDPDPEVSLWLRDINRSWVTTHRAFGEQTDPDPSHLKHYRQHLRHHVFEPTAVSIITETLEPGLESSMWYTEKSIYPMLACNFPIWAGGKSQARYWERFGFDVFHDVIDHSYQDLPTHNQRLYYAIKLNLPLLRDLDRVSELREKMIDRLAANQRHVFTDFADRFIDDCLSKMPNRARKNLQQVVKFLRSVRRYDPI